MPLSILLLGAPGKGGALGCSLALPGAARPRPGPSGAPGESRPASALAGTSVFNRGE